MYNLIFLFLHFRSCVVYAIPIPRGDSSDGVEYPCRGDRLPGHPCGIFVVSRNSSIAYNQKLYAKSFFRYGYTQFEEKGGFIVLPLFFTVVLAILLAVIIFLHKKIALVIAIFKEAMKATFAMPRLLLIPILVSASLRFCSVVRKTVVCFRCFWWS